MFRRRTGSAIGSRAAGDQATSGRKSRTLLARRSPRPRPLLPARPPIRWTLTREALLTDPQALRVSARWVVIAAMQVVQPDKLRRLETWLARCGDGEGPHFALLVDFVPVSAGVIGKSYIPGENFEAEMIFYPSAAPLRALIGRQTSELTQQPVEWQPPHDVPGAIGAHESAVARRPWLDVAPFGVSPAVMRATGTTLWLTDPDGRHGVRVKGSEFERPLTETTIDAAFGLFDGNELSLKFAATPLGRWVAA